MVDDIAYAQGFVAYNRTPSFGVHESSIYLASYCSNNVAGPAEGQVIIFVTARGSSDVPIVTVQTNQTYSYVVDKVIKAMFLAVKTKFPEVRFEIIRIPDFV